MAAISQEELEERVAVLHRFKTLLQQQRNKFQEYLTVLEKQQDSITSENPEKLLAHTELEQEIVRNISTLQKVIIPMKKMYNDKKPNTEADNEEINKLQEDLSDLQSKVMKQNEINRDLIKVHLDQLKSQISNMKNPYKNNRSIYAAAQPQKIATRIFVDA